MIEIEPVLQREQPDVTVVAGDVNSTLAVALTAAKLGLPIAHVEAGLRSRDWSMPEEINRLLTDRLSDLLFTPSRDGNENLVAEGIDRGRIHFVGNVMIDSLQAALPRAVACGVRSAGSGSPSRSDSGGIQEETTALGVPCLTMRENTERPVTVTEGTNQLVGTDPARVIPAAREVLAGRAKKGRLPDLWDGRAAERVAEVLARFGRGE